jgi:uncharacterized protein YkwD
MPRVRLACLAVLLACDAAPEPEVSDESIVPDSEVCEPVAAWDDDHAALEAEFQLALNELRADGGACGRLRFAPAPPVYMDPHLRCAARLHSQDMHLRQYLGQVDPDGLGTRARLDAVEHRASTFAENVGFAAIDPDADIDRMATAAADIAASWADNPLSCWKLRAGELEEICIGAYIGGFTPDEEEPLPGYYWTAIVTAP